MFSRLINIFSRKRTDSGLWGEEQAALFLKANGYKIRGRRVRVGRRDEFDIIAMDGSILVFVEVKTRKSEQYGRPLSAVSARKRHYMSRAAVRFLRSLGNPDVLFRFDVVEVVGSVDKPGPVVRLIKNAFQLDKCYRVK